MALPILLPSGFLPPGAHPGTLADLRSTFVTPMTSTSGHRDLLLKSFELWLTVVETFIPHGTAWVDGGFVTSKSSAPHDLDVVIFPDDERAFRALPKDRLMDFLGLLTLQGIMSPKFGYVSRLQPHGGTIDGFLGFATDRPTWDNTWSKVYINKKLIPGKVKGYVELKW